MISSAGLMLPNIASIERVIAGEVSAMVVFPFFDV
jgi:hypothetical protein